MKVYATIRAYIQANMWLSNPKQSIWRITNFSCTWSRRASPRHLSTYVILVLYLCTMLHHTWSPLISGYKQKWTVYRSTCKLKALNRCALRETYDKGSGNRPPTELPQASSTLLHAVLSTPQCSEQAVFQGRSWAGARMEVQCLRVNRG